MLFQVNGIKCKRCGDTVFSRAHHDYRPCSCGKVAIDGGLLYKDVADSLRYNRYIGEPADIEQTWVDIDFDGDRKAFESAMYNDWNFNHNEYGRIIKGEQRS
jgi:hypothetical protein